MIPSEIIPVTELTDTELNAVSGGLLNNLNIADVAVGGIGAGAAAAVLQALGQGNATMHSAGADLVAAAQRVGDVL
jgi:lactobin A/cerein 7B family class IIb bacteriocin